MYIYNCYIFLEWSLSFWCLLHSRFKVYFVWYKYFNPGYLWFPFAWNTFLHSLTFSLCVSLNLKCIFCRQHIYGSCFYILLATLCLLIGTFIPFFKVIIDRYVLLTFLKIVWGLFLQFLFVPFFFLSLFPCDLMTIFTVLFGFLSGFVCVSIIDFLLAIKIYIYIYVSLYICSLYILNIYAWLF